MAAPRPSDGPGEEPPRWFTAAMAEPAQDRDVRVGETRITYRAWGRPGPAGAVLVHGTAAHARWWDHIAPFLAADGLRVAALSISGHGGSDYRDRYSMDHWAAEVIAVAADAGIDGPPLVIGHSLGGSIAIRTAQLYGDRLAGAVVVDTIPNDAVPPADITWPAAPFGVGRTYPTRAAVLARFRLVPEQPVPSYIREHIAAWSVTAKGNGEWGWKFDQTTFTKIDPLPAPSPVSCPVALFYAEHGLMSADLAARLRRQLGGAVPVAQIPAAGHHVLLDEPLSLVTALRTLLASWSPAAAPGTNGN